MPLPQNPTVQEYFNWAHSKGIEYRTGTSMHHSAVWHLIKVHDSEGNTILNAGFRDMDAKLPPEQVAHYNRRLGLTAD